MRTVLIVDRDLGFVFWLGQLLDAAGSVAIPAKGIPEAIELIDMLHLPVDVLVAPPGELGLREFVERLRFISPELQVIALASEEDPTWAMPLPGSVWKRKPRQRNEAAKTEWLDLIHEMDRHNMTPFLTGKSGAV